jgi:hypothetical protein
MLNYAGWLLKMLLAIKLYCSHIFPAFFLSLQHFEHE